MKASPPPDVIEKSTDTTVEPVARLASTEGSWNIADLIAHGWTRTSITRILGEPDFVHPLRINRYRPERRYLLSRIEAAEKAAGQIRYRRERGTLTEDDTYEPNSIKRVWSPWVPCDGDPRHDPAVWLSKLSVQYHLDIASPCFVDRLLFTTEDAVLRVFVHVASAAPWNCPHCGQRCALYDHRPERVCYEAKSHAVSCLMLGRQPRYRCKKHGVRTVPLLSSFEDPPAPKDTFNRQCEWVIKASI
jgi:hypothetical protein